MGCDHARKCGGDKSPPLGTCCCQRNGNQGSGTPKRHLMPPQPSQARHSTPSQRNSPRMCRSRGRTALGTLGPCTAWRGHGHCWGPARQAVGTDSIFSLLPALRAAERVPPPPAEGGSAQPGLQPPSKTSHQLGWRHLQPLGPEHSIAGSHPSDPEMAREHSVPARSDPHPELLWGFRVPGDPRASTGHPRAGGIRVSPRPSPHTQHMWDGHHPCPAVPLSRPPAP